MKLLIIFSYDGSKFYGFQRQKDKRNVQGTIEEALSKIYSKEIQIKGAGRTDRGVHAKNQAAHFVVPYKVSGLKRKLNSYLNDIKIKRVKTVEDDFHARHSVKSKTYIYKIALNGNKNSNYFYNLKYSVDIDKMKKVANYFVGTHDFKNFVSGKRDDYTSTIFSIKFKKKRNILTIAFKGVGFYRYMVRNLVGALIAVGRGKVNEQDILYALNCQENMQFPTAPPNGLYLRNIEY